VSAAEYDAVIVGGGFYGSHLALDLRTRRHWRVLLLEREHSLFQRASYANQARVHNGYHYPRSLVTGLRSRINFPRFVEEFSDCIDRSFDKYYAIARLSSNVTAAQFRRFCERIEAPLDAAPPDVVALFDRDRIEAVFRVREHAFDSVALNRAMLARLHDHAIDVRLGVEADTVRPLDDGRLEVACMGSDGPDTHNATWVFNCTYSRLNRLLTRSGLASIPLKHELVEVPLLEVPDTLHGLGITVMCGPFFSVMPFPPRGLHSLHHVRYTVHYSWQDRADAAWIDPGPHLTAVARRSNLPYMIADAARYLPDMTRCRHVDSLWEVKTVLPRSEADDSRPILCRRDHALPNLVSIMGAKIDNVYDVEDYLAAALA
jgi:glycine/D-amino acid oxidase-like deaminating enzyme